MSPFSTPPIPGAPPAELSRTAAARAIAQMAHDSGLRLAHFEHRFAMPLPEEWEVPDADLGPYPWSSEGGWRPGSLPETKFRSFRLDRRIGSFHPSHGGKWTVHELCHGLVGFGWRPSASPLWLATAARLAELVPVALWYFFDEAGAQRCPRHAGGGALFGATCLACERVGQSEQGPDFGTDPRMDRWLRQGRIYVEAEIDAAWRTLASGVPISNRYGTLDLCTDGLAYVRAHGPVLRSPVFGAWVERFCREDTGWHVDLESLVARARDVVAAVSGEGLAPPLAAGRSKTGLWKLQDVGWRLLQLRVEVEGEAGAAIAAMVDRLAAAVDEGDADSALSDVISEYTQLYDEVELPLPEHLFAVGYPLPYGHGSAVEQLAAGLATTLPTTWQALGTDAMSVAAEWAADDPWDRRGIGDRFADWARDRLPLVLAERAALEAALVHVDAPDLAARALQGMDAQSTHRRRAAHVRVVKVTHDVAADPEFPGTDQPLDAPAWLAVLHDVDGSREVLSLTERQGELLSSSALVDLATDDREQVVLDEAGLLAPLAWSADA